MFDLAVATIERGAAIDPSIEAAAQECWPLCTSRGGNGSRQN